MKKVIVYLPAQTHRRLKIRWGKAISEGLNHQSFSRMLLELIEIGLAAKESVQQKEVSSNE